MTTTRLFMYYSCLVAMTAGVSMALDHFYPNSALVPGYWWMFGFMATITLLAYLFSMQGIRKGGETSIFTLMIVMGLKLFICMAGAIVFLLHFRPDNVVFMGNFFCVYFLYTAFELYFLLRNLRHQKITGKS